jgi:AraC-like DNA-binding protein
MKIKEARSVSPFNSELKLKGFNAFEIEADGNATRVYSRKDFYKICLSTGKSIIHYADRSYTMDGTILFFGNPHIPYSWQTMSSSYSGYACLFSEEFIKSSERSEAMLQSPLFKIGGTPVIPVSETQREFLSTIFHKIIAEQQSDYPYKDELIHNYIHLLIHEALKLQPSKDFHRQKNGAYRLTAVFLELLERQFPIEHSDKPLALRTPQDFASNLSVHVNHLNRSVREVTGKSTSTQIAERMIAEARALLQHTDWTVAEIAYALGFEYPTYFNNFFKKMTGKSPSMVRSENV